MNSLVHKYIYNGTLARLLSHCIISTFSARVAFVHTHFLRIVSFAQVLFLTLCLIRSYTNCLNISVVSKVTYGLHITAKPLSCTLAYVKDGRALNVGMLAAGEIVCFGQRVCIAHKLVVWWKMTNEHEIVKKGD